MSAKYEELRYGFTYGAAVVTRVADDDKQGWVALEIKTPKEAIHVRVTRTGKIRVSSASGEWLCVLDGHRRNRK